MFFKYITTIYYYIGNCIINLLLKDKSTVKLTVKTSSVQSKETTMVIENANEEIVFDLFYYDSAVFLTHDLFQYINSYLARMPPNVQQDIFNEFKNARILIDECHDEKQLLMGLTNITKKLLNPIKFNDVRNFVLYNSGIIIPDIFEREYIASIERAGSREQTYIYSDYVDLITLSVILKLMIPIFSEFILFSRKVLGNTHKEFFAVKIMDKTSIMNEAVIQKLLVYINERSSGVKTTNSSYMSLIGVNDIDYWMLALLMTKPLAIGDVRGLDPKSTLVTSMFKFINNRINNGENNFENAIRDKEFDASDGDSGKTSRLEDYKNKYPFSQGDLAKLAASVSDPYQYILKIAPSIDITLLDNSLKTTYENLTGSVITEAQITIAQWVLSEVIVPNGIAYLDNNTILKALAACQAVLIHRGHYQLAGIVTARTNNNTKEIMLGGTESRGKLTKAIVDELDRLYPHFKNIGGKRTSDTINIVIKSIDEVCDMISKHTWILTVDDSVLKLINETNNTRRYIIPHHIKTLVANLVIELANHNYKL
jgi:hypothetical protein